MTEVLVILFRLGLWQVGLVLLQKLVTVKADRIGVLLNEGADVELTRQLVEVFVFNRNQVPLLNLGFLLQVVEGQAHCNPSVLELLSNLQLFFFTHYQSSSIL